jgi:hypothetical protein
METLGNKNMPQKIEKYYCKYCDYGTSKKSSFTNHSLSTKHIKSIKVNTLETFGNEIMPKLCSDKFTCEKCNKEFKNRSGLWKHNKKCFEKVENSNKEDTNIVQHENTITPELVIEIIKQNQELQKQNNELQKQMLEVIKNGTNNNTNINSHNKTFNLQVFLNETCKDAMNIMDFVDSIKIQLSDIESIGELGYVNGMSKLIIKHLNALDENMRPVHCSDPKRDSLYVKDKNVWEKEDPDNKKIKKAIKYISHKNICALPEWKAKYPDCIYSDSNKSDQYNHIVIEAMGGSGDNDAEKADKIVKKIAKVVTIDKK